MMVQFTLLVLVALAASVTSTDVEKPLSECEPLLHVVNMIRANNIPDGQTRESLITLLRQRRVAFETAEDGKVTVKSCVKVKKRFNAVSPLEIRR